VSAFEDPWGIAIALIVLLAPRALARRRDPLAMRRFGNSRLLVGYATAVGVALATLALADPLQLRSWIEALPIRSARELAMSSSSLRYVLAALVAWLLAAYLVAPVAAWLASYERANGILLAAACLPAALIIGFLLSLTWETPAKEIPFTVASSCCLVLALAIGFSLGARLPLTVRLGGKSAT
jgi:hypothetical protein